ncbi:hypothetical protein HELRODRAFT_192056 [Helobdella robusta]|uniref:Mitochondrial inner membrane protease ATP23 n=1 Tax=Helobdella robusta TaxID=6412 RepID=T1FTJ8_HELRO|nr:hypothetical protein HELRODRAFT_192056 [Helobdella robusta]ESO03482.1 hypothetical protein HELRODRAFT_192056 [Helobdella robusta]
MSDSEKNKKYESRNPDKKEDFGYGYYPSRSPNNKPDDGDQGKGWFKKLSEGKSIKNHLNCASNVMQCIEHNRLVKILISALKKNGCEYMIIFTSFSDFNPKRHVSCENCLSKVNGGYDPSNNQIVVCQNASTDQNVCCAVLTHELVHMFDYCRADVDFKNLEHLACTEIRAASFMHCRFFTAMSEGDASFFNYKNRHQECVKRKAIMSVLMVRNITYDQASAAVDRVFQRCYRDTEPFGRIPRMNSSDPEKILIEGYLYGYGS